MHIHQSDWLEPVTFMAEYESSRNDEQAIVVGLLRGGIRVQSWTLSIDESARLVAAIADCLAIAQTEDSDTLWARSTTPPGPLE